jgi:RNA polymerase sigma-70 factor (ECF subfamily)
MSTAPTPAGLSTEELFRAHAPFVARFLFRLGVRPDAIDDALQEVFVVVLRQGGYRPGPASPTSYLGNIALHAATAYRRRERSREAREQDAPVEHLAWTGSDPVQVLETNEGLRKLQNALERLDPDLRSTLVLAELEGETCPSIAAAMGVPVGTVYWRLHQARKRFQHALKVVASTSAPRRAFTLQVAGAAGAPENSGKNRAGLMILMMSSGRGRESADLLRLGRQQPPVRYAVDEGLARHRQLAASGAIPPEWAESLGGKAAAAWAGWWVVGVAVVGAMGGAAAWRAESTPPATRARTVTVVAAPARDAPSPPSGSNEDRGWIPVLVAPDPTAQTVPAAAAPERPTFSQRPILEPHRATSDRSSAQTEASDPSVDSRPPTDHATGPEPSAPTGDDMLELQQVATAERLLSTDPARALGLVRSVEARFPTGFVREERRYVEIAALTKLGRTAEARGLAEPFLRDYPDGAFSRRVRDGMRTPPDGP